MNNFLLKIKNFLKNIGDSLSPIKTFINKHYDIFNPIFVLTAICLIVAAALSLTNSLTAAKITAINLENKNNQMAALVPADSYNETALSGFETDDNFSFYLAIKEANVEGYIVTTSAKGYSGDIIVMTAFNTDSTIKGISILGADDETPGLGQNIKKEDFYSQFSGLNTNAEIVKISPDKASGAIKAVTGATISSKGVASAVNSARSALTAYLNTPGLDTLGGGAVAE